MRPGIWQIVLVIVLLFILFGSNKIPDMMKNLAGGINVFKKELKDDKKQEAAPQKKVVAKKPAAKKVALVFCIRLNYTCYEFNRDVGSGT